MVQSKISLFSGSSLSNVDSGQGFVFRIPDIHTRVDALLFFQCFSIEFVLQMLTKSPDRDMKSRLVILCMFCYGFAFSVPRFLLLMATEDIMSGTLIQSSVVMILIGCAGTLGTVCFPLLIRKISFPWAFVLFTLLWLISYLLIVIAEDPIIRLLGVATYGIVDVLANVSIILLAACFEKTEKCISAYITGGTSSAILVGFLYTGSTVWLCLPPRITIIICFPLGLLTNVFYVILYHGPLKKYQRPQPVEKKPLHIDENNNMPVFEMILKIFPLMGCYFICFFAYFLAINSVLTTLAFSSAPFRARDHYQYYRLAGDIGTFVGGLEMLMVSYLCPCWKNNTSPRYCTTSILLLSSVAHLIFFFFTSWYRFVPSVFIILVLCLSQGVLFGSIVVRGLVHVGEKFENSNLKGTAMSICTLGVGLGRAISGFLGIFIEESMREHCTNELLMGHFCLARFSSMVGWDENMQCS